MCLENCPVPCIKSLIADYKRAGGVCSNRDNDLITLSRKTSDLKVEKVPKRKRQHVNSIKQMNVNMQNVSGYKNFFGCN